MNDDERRGKFLTKLRLDKNLKQSDLAKMIGYSDKSISKWERGVCFPKNTKVLIQLAEIFNVSLDEILQGEYSDIEGKFTPKSNNKILNFFIKYRVILVIIFIILLILAIIFYYFVMDFNSSFSKIYLFSEEVENIDVESFDELDGEDNKVYDDEDKSKVDISKNSKRNDNNEIKNILLSEGFEFDGFDLIKHLNENVFIYYLIEIKSFKIFDYSNEDYLIIILSSNFLGKVIIEKEYLNKHTSEHLNIDEIKDCNKEICESYLDYAMYINYLKKLILE